MSDMYWAMTSGINGNAANGWNYLYIPKWESDAAPNDVVCLVGWSESLPADVASIYGGGGTNCTAANGCGVHVHSGTGCENKTTQGGHWWNSDVLSEDPWKTVGYKQTNVDGYGKFAACVSTGYDLVSDPSLLLGKPFIVHNEDGSRASCGIIKEIPDGPPPPTFSSKMEPIPGVEGNMTGEVTVMTTFGGIEDASCYMGVGTGMEVDVTSFLMGTGSETCDVPNGCGAHIHSGTGCENKTVQGGHYWEGVAEDPWKLESYYSTDAEGTGYFYGCTINGDGATEYDSKPFIVHNTAGGRMLCGVLEEVEFEESSAATKSIVAAVASIVIAGLALF